jgi:hypothetical protein
MEGRNTDLGMIINRILPKVILLICLFGSCDKQQTKVENYKSTFEDFRDNLTKEMDYQAIVVKFGEPARDIGSGIHIYVWELKDSTEIWIGYVDKIFYARHVDKDRNILHTLL